MRPLRLLLLGTTTISAFSLPAVLRPYLQIPFTSPSRMSSAPASDSRTSGLVISDILPQTQKINIFAGLTRDIDPISDRLDSASQQSTILAPLNSAIQAMERKPWEDESEIKAFGSDSEAYGLGDGEWRAHQNLKRFVERHIVPESPWEAGKKVQSLAGGELWWEDRDGDRFIMPGEIKVAGVAGQAENGEVWILEGVVKK